MLGVFTFTEPICIHIPLTLNLDNYTFKCHGDEIFLGDFTIGIMDDTSRPYLN